MWWPVRPVFEALKSLLPCIAATAKRVKRPNFRSGGRSPPAPFVFPFMGVEGAEPPPRGLGSVLSERGVQGALPPGRGIGGDVPPGKQIKGQAALSCNLAARGDLERRQTHSQRGGKIAGCRGAKSPCQGMANPEQTRAGKKQGDPPLPPVRGALSPCTLFPH